ncbi:MAG: pyridoxal-dependent decarboxylase [Acidobacteria bacterium]|nr:pyridoxal-dependent decarboxylase [Acidobacteriota bacterium]
MASDDPERLGDMDAEAFRRHGYALVDWIAAYLSGVERHPVLSPNTPGAVRDALPATPPETGLPFEETLREFERVILPGITHWNHPGFFAYFAISGSAAGVLAEFLSAALNVQAMLWRTSPAATELEQVTLDWLRQLLGLPAGFEGVIYDTASIASLHALAAARHVAVPDVRTRGLRVRDDLGPLRVYASEQAHSSIDKAVMTLGLGHDALVRIPVDADFRMRPGALREAVAGDRARGATPLAVVATVGTTSTTSVDPVGPIARIAGDERIWLHVDAAYAGAAALVPETCDVLAGCGEADSLVVNPHKWLFVPFDLSAFYCRRMDTVRAAFSLTPDYLRTPEAGAVRNLMDTGVQLGRRFRSLKLWAVLRHFGSDGIRDRLAEHMRLARQFAAWVDESPHFERLAPVPFSVVCFRAAPRGSARGQHMGAESVSDNAATDNVAAEVAGSAAAELDALNERLLEAVNATGEVFLSHTRLRGRFAIRLAVGHVRTEERHVRRAWELFNDKLRAL